ncbi:hypothetical protein QE152_g30471 [Popillia japonica]|uniref:C-type lectin domain-containing protein n=1 Tax=Popillia japonica TaxID=7064 RepID=A0AAW1JE49_POPJA
MQVIANSGTATAAKTIDGYWESLEEQLIRAADDSQNWAAKNGKEKEADDSLGCKKWKRKGSWFNHECKEEKEKTKNGKEKEAGLTMSAKRKKKRLKQ